MLVGEVVERERLDLFVRATIGLVVDPEPPLFLDRVALVVEVVLHDGERPHAVGFEEQRRVELIRRHRFEVERPLLAGGAVHRAAVAEDGIEVLAGADVLGALEHHVFEQVGEPGPARRSSREPTSDQGDGEYRRRVIFRDDHAQTIGQLRVAELHRRRGEAASGAAPNHAAMAATKPTGLRRFMPTSDSIIPSPHHPITPSPHHPETPLPHYPITPLPHYPITPLLHYAYCNTPPPITHVFCDETNRFLLRSPS